MSSRFTSAFDDLLAKNRRELDALYQGAAPSGRGRAPTASPVPGLPPAPPDRAPEPPSRAEKGPPGPADGGDRWDRGTAADGGTGAATEPPPAASPAARLLDERYGDGWRFEITSRRREKDEAIVVGALRLPGSGGVRTQFGSARISPGGGAGSGSAGGVAFSFGGAAAGTPLAAEEAAFERAREDALARCAALVQEPAPQNRSGRRWWGKKSEEMGNRTM